MQSFKSSEKQKSRITFESEIPSKEKKTLYFKLLFIRCIINAKYTINGQLPRKPNLDLKLLVITSASSESSISPRLLLCGQVNYHSELVARCGAIEIHEYQLGIWGTNCIAFHCWLSIDLPQLLIKSRINYIRYGILPISTFFSTDSKNAKSFWWTYIWWKGNYFCLHETDF